LTPITHKPVHEKIVTMELKNHYLQLKENPKWRTQIDSPFFLNNKHYTIEHMPEIPIPSSSSITKTIIPLK